jgi:hypothetical protein
MAVSGLFNRGGRPRFVADIDHSHDSQLHFRYEFKEVCSAFKYRDIMALSRSFDIAPNTIERWKYGISFPRKETAEKVLEWVKAGKPMKMESPGQKAASFSLL